jgi:hypothetical protein
VPTRSAGNCRLDISDAVWTPAFLGGPPPAAPFPGCGAESLPEEARALDCATPSESCR